MAVMRGCWLMACALALVACGGAESDEPRAMTKALAAREQPQAVPAGVDPVATTVRLLDYAEQVFPQYFPERQANRTLSGWVYRYYPSTGAYIAVIDWRIYVLGGPFGAEAIDVGEVTRYVTAVPLANPPPTVRLTSPTAGTLIAPASIALAADASDSGAGRVVRVEFYSGATKIGEATEPPYSLSWPAVPAGSYSLSAVATDDLGARTTSAAVNVTVAPNKAPTVLLISPTGGSSVTLPAAVSIVAAPTDDQAITRVDFYAGATKIGEATRAPFSLNWTAPTAGTYSLTAVAIDSAGLSSTSNAVSVTINAAPPTPSPPGTLTASQIGQCPATSGASATNFYLCMIGGLTGAQLFDTSKTCTLSISAAGVVTLSSNGENYVINVTSGGSVSFTRSSYLLVQLRTPVSLYPSIRIVLDSVLESGRNFIPDGGKLQVDAESFDPRPTPTVTKSLSCMFTVPKI